MWFSGDMWTHIASLIWLLLLGTSVESMTSPDDKCMTQLVGPVKHDISCRYGIRECAPLSLEADFPDHYNKSTWRAPAPASVSLDPFCSNGTDTETGQPAISITWKLPDDSGASLIRGFEIRMEGQSHGYGCIVVKLEEEIQSPGLTFTGTINFLQPKRRYVITIQSLPRNNASGTLNEYVTTPVCGSNGPISAKWAVKQFDVTYDHVTERLDVAFEEPPKVFGFEEYELCLLTYKGDTYANMTSLKINQTQHTFEGIKPGDYRIWVTPSDPYPQKEEKCKCKNELDVCSRCTMSQIKYVAVAEPLIAEAVRQTYNKKPVVTAVIVAAIVATALVAVGISIAVSRRRNQICLPYPTAERKLGIEETRTLVVFIDTKRKNNQTTKKTARALEEVKTQLQNETGVRVADNVFMLNEKLSSSLTAAVSTCSTNQSQTETQNPCTIQENGKVNINMTKSENEPLIVCCLVLSEETPMTDLEIFRKEMEALNKIYKAINVCVALDKISPDKVLLCGDSKYFELPDANGALIKYIRRDCARTNATGNVPNVVTYRSSNMALNVDLDSKRPKIDLNVDIKTSRMEFLPRMDVSRPTRERYVSNDSGKGGSVDSNGYTPLEYTLDIADETDLEDHLHSANCSQPFRNISDVCHAAIQASIRCPSGVYFAPPEPSEISEADIADSYRSSNSRTPNGYMPISHIQQMSEPKESMSYQMERNTRLVVNNDDNSSMDTIMSKMAAINAKSENILEADLRTDETYSVFEGRA